MIDCEVGIENLGVFLDIGNKNVPRVETGNKAAPFGSKGVFMLSTNFSENLVCSSLKI
jgi:hypothetical protein